MTIVPIYKICPRCKKRYAWNPDVGRLFCPNCGMLYAHKNIQTLLEIFQKKKK